MKTNPVLLLVAAAAVTTLAALVAGQGSPQGSVMVQLKLIDSPLDDIQWADSETVFVLTEQGNLYRSGDGGKGWTNQMSKLHSASSVPTIRSIHVSQVNPNNIFFMGTGTENWVTFDMGKTYKPTAPLNLHEVRLHPRQSMWVLGASMSSGCGAADKGGCYKIMHLSKDFGATWAEAVNYVVQFDWAPYGNSTSKTKTTQKHADIMARGEFKDADPIKSDDLVYATIHEVKKGNQKFGMWDKNIHMYQSLDYFTTSVRIVRHGNRFLFGDHGYLFVAAVNPHQESEVSLQVSRESGIDRKFKTALLPVELTEHSYTILDTSEGSVFLHVNHQPFDLNAPTGHVYTSDWSGTQYALSLPYNHRSGDGKCDFEKVEGLEGIYLANFIDETETEPKVETWTEDNTKGNAKQASGKRLRTKTVITFDKGGIWSYLEPPEFDSTGKKTSCPQGKECRLHLHGITDLYGPFYSAATAVGLIMSTGTVGSYLQENVDKINTYLSRDGGLTWFEVAKGSHIYEFGDHGGLIVMAYDEGETDSVLYSWDQGITWKSLKISPTPLQVENIIIEPEAVSQRFVVYGWQEDSGVLIYLDFSELHERECQGHDAPDSPNSDYEVWSPSDGRVGKCLLGHKVSYTRRKRAAQCFIPEEFERATLLSHCTCSAEDFECDYGYFRKLESGECVPDLAVEPLPVVPADCSDKYFISKGYRRVAGDTCTGGEQWDLVPQSCPGWFGASGFGKIALFLVIAVIVGYGVNTCYKRSEFLEDLVDSIKSRFGKNQYFQVGQRLPDSAVDHDDEFGLEDEFGGGSGAPQLLKDSGHASEGGKGKKKTPAAQADEHEDF